MFDVGSVITGFVGGVTLVTAVSAVLIHEINCQWRADYKSLDHVSKQQIKQAEEAARQWRSVANHRAVDPGVTMGDGAEAVQVGVGEFYHLAGAEMVDPVEQPDMFANANPGERKD